MAKNLFNGYKGSPIEFNSILSQIQDKRCKLIEITEFNPEKSWIIENWWTDAEKIELGLKKEEKTISINEFIEKLTDLENSIKDIINQLKM